jgi:hypothetical protein
MKTWTNPITNQTWTETIFWAREDPICLLYSWQLQWFHSLEQKTIIMTIHFHCQQQDGSFHGKVFSILLCPLINHPLVSLSTPSVLFFQYTVTMKFPEWFYCTTSVEPCDLVIVKTNPCIFQLPSVMISKHEHESCGSCGAYKKSVFPCLITEMSDWFLEQWINIIFCVK